MTPEHRELVKRVRCWNGQSVGPMAFQAADAIEVLSAERNQLAAELEQYIGDAERVNEYVGRLVMFAYENHWKTEGNDFGLFPDSIGRLTQLDNMLAGMCRKSDTVALVADVDRLRAALEAIIDDWSRKTVDAGKEVLRQTAGAKEAT